MNGVAHYLVGIILTLLIIRVLNFKINDVRSNQQIILVMSLIFFVSFFSHIIVDGFAHFTYHPSESDWGEPVYTTWHFMIYLSEAIFAIFFLRTDIRYTVGMIGSVGFDLWDWSIRRPLENYANVTDLPSLHWMADKFENRILGGFNSLRNEQWALIIEIIIILILFVIWRVMHDDSELSVAERPATWFELTILIIFIGTLRILTLF